MCGKSVIVAEGVGHLFVDDRDIAREAAPPRSPETTSIADMDVESLRVLLAMVKAELKARIGPEEQ